MWRPEEGVRSPETGDIGICELSDMRAGNRTWASCKSSILLTTELFLQLQHAILSRPLEPSALDTQVNTCNKGLIFNTYKELLKINEKNLNSPT